MTLLLKIAAPILAITAPITPTIAQDAAPASKAAEPKVALKSDVMAIVTKTDDMGRQTISLEEPKEFTPGTKLSFGVNYANNGGEPVTNVTGTNPLNAAVRLAPDADPALVVSVDGGKTFGTLDTLSVATETQGSRPAAHADVTHVRWTIVSIAPGESGRVGFPVIIR